MIGLCIHAGAYVIGNAWLAFSPLEISPLWPLAGWGLALGVHAFFAALAPGGGREVEGFQ